MQYRILKIVVPKVYDDYYIIEKRKNRWGEWKPINKTKAEVQLFTYAETLAILKTI